MILEQVLRLIYKLNLCVCIHMKVAELWGLLIDS